MTDDAMSNCQKNAEKPRSPDADDPAGRELSEQFGFANTPICRARRYCRQSARHLRHPQQHMGEAFGLLLSACLDVRDRRGARFGKLIFFALDTGDQPAAAWLDTGAQSSYVGFTSRFELELLGNREFLGRQAGGDEDKDKRKIFSHERHPF
jgi:hypothetical protein